MADQENENAVEELRPQQLNRPEIPIHIVKKIMKIDKEVKKINSEAAFLVAKLTDLFLQFLACAMAIDGLYLLGNIEDMVRRVPNDVWMMENQLPGIVLNELGNISDPEYLFITMVGFCLRDSPFMHTIEDDETIPKNTSHLLDMMYRLVRNDLYPKAKPAESGGVKLMSSSFVEELVGVAADLSGAKFLGFIAKLPYDECSNLFGTLNFSMEDIQVPSASRLHRHPNIQFKELNPGGKVRYDEEERTLYLPVMTLDSTHSEVVLRNRKGKKWRLLIFGFSFF